MCICILFVFVLSFYLHLYVHSIPIQAEPDICRCASPSVSSIAALLPPSFPEQSLDNSCTVGVRGKQSNVPT